MQIEAVIFDFDGVIVDTEPLHYKAFQEILSPKGLGYSWEDYVSVYMGFDDRDAFNEAYRRKGAHLSKKELEELICQKADVFQKVISDGVAPYPGVLELIRNLEARNIPIAICSGALRSDIEPIIANLGISESFTHIVTADDVPHSKPDPTCYIMAYQKLAESFPDKISKPENCMAIEDTPAGIAAAKGAGLKVVAVTNSYPDNELGKADTIVTQLDLLLS